MAGPVEDFVIYMLLMQINDLLFINSCLLTTIILLQSLKALRRLRKKRNRIYGYCADVIPTYRLDEFRIHFRMTRGTVQIIFEEIGEVLRNHPCPPLVTTPVKGGREKIPLQNKLLMFLWFMATKCTYREIANQFGSTESSCCNTIHKLIELISKYMLAKIIRWPNEDEKREIAVCIEDSRNFPGVIGLIDGCHIPIKRPAIGGAMYYNRKDFYSIILQAVCREDMRFTDVFVGFPGRVHDARVFNCSPLFENGSAMCGGEFHILGDSAYPNLDWLLTPFRHNRQLTPNMINYNRIHSSIRVTIERAFALLKGRFKRMKYIDQDDEFTMVSTIVTACCLHNICIMQDDIEEHFSEEGEVPVAFLQAGVFDNDLTARGAVKRNRIMEHLAR